MEQAFQPSALVPRGFVVESAVCEDRQSRRRLLNQHPLTLVAAS
jgi:hypothetical protein